MDMVGHQTNQIEPHLKAFARLSQLIEKALSVGILPEDDSTFVSSKSNVINRAGILQPQASRHAKDGVVVSQMRQELIFILRADPNPYIVYIVFDASRLLP